MGVILISLQKVDLRLKWPNDIYYGNTMKLGGVIVKSSIMADVIHANVGMCRSLTRSMSVVVLYFNQGNACS